MQRVTLLGTLLAAPCVALAAPSFVGGDGCECGSPWHHSTLPQIVHADRTYPPDVPADFTHMTLDIMIEDMNTPRFHATQRLTFAPIGTALTTLAIDAKALHVDAVAAERYTTTFTADGSKLRVVFDPPVPAGESVTLVTSYRVDDPPLGLIWTPESPAWPARPAQLHTQGQTETNSYWFPCHDYPNDRLTTEIIVTVPRDFMAVSNGRLVSHTKIIRTRERDDGSTEMVPAERFHWLQDTPHVPYLVSLVVGKFDAVDLAGSPVPARVYAPLGRGADVTGTFGRTGAMISYFARVLGHPYPWHRYDQLVVWNFAHGGMENTSATTLHENAVIRRSALVDHDFDGLIAHELAHQWFGNLVTCNSWEHIWLNEGMTTFMNTLWFEERDGRDAYLARLRDTYDALSANDRPEAPAAQGMASKVYRDSWETFRRPANPYSKGASVMHMLRAKLGDDVFFRGLAEYINRHKFSTVETSDLRRALEDVSGETLEQFFAQWVFRPGVPSLVVSPTWDGQTLTIPVEQVQNINPDNPAFEFDLPVVVGQAGGPPARTVVPVRGRSASASIPLAAEPLWVAIDPDLSVLCAIDLRVGEASAIALLQNGPTLPARVQGARRLGALHVSDAGTTRGTEALRTVLLDTRAPTPLRVEAVRALLARGAEVDLRTAATGAVDRWEVREATTRALATILKNAGERADPAMRERFLGQLAERASRDPSLRVRAAAITGLGQVGALEHLALLERALAADSQGDIVRQAAIEAHALLDTPASLRAVLPFARPGNDSRTRAVAVEAAARLARHDQAAVLDLASTLLNDRELRTRRAAGEALVTLRDPRGLAALQQRLAAARGPDDRRMVERWIEGFEQGAGR